MNKNVQNSVGLAWPSLTQSLAPDDPYLFKYSSEKYKNVYHQEYLAKISQYSCLVIELKEFEEQIYGYLDLVPAIREFGNLIGTFIYHRAATITIFLYFRSFTELET